MMIRETWVNATEGYRGGDSEFYEPYTDDTGELFRSLQREFGRCTGRMYVDVNERGSFDVEPRTEFQNTEFRTKAIGWVFEKRERYTDCDETYLQETWVEARPDM